MDVCQLINLYMELWDDDMPAGMLRRVIRRLGMASAAVAVAALEGAQGRRRRRAGSSGAGGPSYCRRSRRSCCCCTASQWCSSASAACGRRREAQVMVLAGAAAASRAPSPGRRWRRSCCLCWPDSSREMMKKLIAITPRSLISSHRSWKVSSRVFRLNNYMGSGF